MSNGYSMGKQYELYLSDESRKTGEAEEIFFPTTREEVLDAVACDIPITIQGARTGLDGRAVPHGGRIVNLSRLKGIIGEEVVPDGSLMLEVLPGTTMEELKAYGNHFFPAMPSELSSTVGGCIATGARSIFAEHYGPISQYVSCVDTLFLPQDKHVITTAKLKLLPKPQTLWAITFFFPQDADARRFSHIAHSIKNVAVNEYMDAGALEAIVSCSGKISRLESLKTMLQHAGAMVYLEIHDDSEEAIFESAGTLLEEAMVLGCPDEATWSFSGEREVWQMREIYHAAQEGINSQIDAIRLTEPALYGVGVEFEHLENYEAYQQQWEELSIPYACFGNVCSGRMRLSFIPKTQEQYEKAVAYIHSIPSTMKR